MKKIFILTAVLLVAVTNYAQTFTPGNIVVFVAGASANNTTGSIVELNTTAVGQSALNSYSIIGTGTDALRFSGSATSTGYLANSDDGTLLSFTGANNTNTGSNVNTLNPRGVGTLNSSYTFTLATTYTGSSGNQTRGSTSLDNSAWYIGDQGGIYSNGTSSASPPANIRSIKSFNGIVYSLSASSTGTVIVVSTVSAAIGGTITGLPGLTNNSSAQDFYLVSSGSNGNAYDLLYVLSATSNTAGTIAKYSLVAGSWTSNGSYTTTFGGFGMAAYRQGNGINLFVSTGLGALTANSVVRLTDEAGYNTAININTGNNLTLYTTAAGTIIKGIAFAPCSSAPTSVIASSNSTICSGSDLSLTSSATGAVSYSWVGPNSFSSVSQNPTISGAAVASSGTYTVTAINACGISTATTSVTINASPSAFNITGGGSYCSGGAGMAIGLDNSTSGVNYQLKNSGGSNIGSLVAGNTGNAISFGNITAADTYSAVATDGSNSCSNNMTGTATVVITATVTPSVSIAAGPSNTVCAGSDVTLSATPSSGGASPSYAWTLNGNSVGSNSPTYIDVSPADGDLVACVLTSNAACVSPATANSNTITISVTGSVIPTVSIAPGSTTNCSGAAVTFTATPTNGGSTPSYQWKLNNVNDGTNSDTYLNNSFADQDIVSCIMTSSNGCASPTTATSNSVTMTVTPNVTPSVSITITPSTTICAGVSVTLTANPTNGGTTSYQWVKNGGNAGSSATYIDASLANIDEIYCTITSSLNCITSPTASSNTVIMTVNPLASQPAAFTTSSANVNLGQTGVVYTVPNDPSVTYTWSYSGTGATINGSNNSVTVDFSGAATSGILSVTATNGCGTSIARTIAITVAVFQPSDLLFVAYQMNAVPNNDRIAFVTFVNIPASTAVNITDAKYTTNATPQCSGGITWTSPAGGVAAGTVVVIDLGASTVNIGTLTGSSFGLSSGGDQLIVYTGTAASPTYVTALSSNAWVGSNTACGGSISILPTGLTDGINSINLSTAPGNTSGNTVNAYYTGTMSGTATVLKTSITNPANWNGTASGTNAQTWPNWTFPGPPAIISATVLNSTTIRLAFNSDLDNISATNTANFTGIANLSSVARSSNGNLNDTLLLTYSTPFASATSYTLTIAGVQDVNNNPMFSPYMFAFNYNTTIGFNASMISVTESVGQAIVQFNLTFPSTSSVDLVVKTAPFSTADATDFTLSTQTINFTGASSATYTINIPIADDITSESDEYFVLSLENAVNCSVSGSQYMSIYIRDNDNAAPVPVKDIELSFVGSYDPSGGASATSEIVVHDPVSQRLFIISAVQKRLDIADFSNPASIQPITSVDMTPYGGITSVAVKNGIVAVSSPNANEQLNGSVVFLDIHGVFQKQVTVGALPDMITFTPDGSKVLTANEGQPNDAYTVDPEGSVSIIDISGGIAALSQANVTTLDFTSFNAQTATLLAAGVRKGFPGSTLSQDLEPEYITVTPNSQTAWVALQEANAFAVINLTTNTITEIWPLGKKDCSLPGNGFDASDIGSNVHISNWPVKELYMPDGIQNYTAGGTTYIVGANEGDDREYSGFNERVKVNAGTYILDPTVFPNAASLKQDNNLGKLKVTKVSGDTDSDGDFDEIHLIGGRSFSIWDATTRSVVYDSGDDFESYLSKNSTYAPLFNADNGSNAFKSRSSAKGPEPEGITLADINGRTFAFITLERMGGVMTYDVTNPANVQMMDYNTSRNLSTYGGDNGPEGISYISSQNSPDGKYYLLTANEISGTVAVFEIKNNFETPITVSAGSNVSICAGASTTLNATGGASLYSWSPSAGLSCVNCSNPTANPSASTTYTLTGTHGIYTSTALVTVTVNSIPAVTANASPAAVCAGTSLTLTGAGASTYVWSDGVNDGVAFVPTSTATYTVTGTTAGCSNTSTVAVTVNSTPTVTANASATTVCAGSTITLTGGGASTYSWSGGVSDGVGFVPVNTTYTVTGTNTVTGCSNAATKTITVHVLPVVSLGADVTQCAGSVILDAGNAGSTYAWFPSGTAQTIFVSSTGTYSVVVTNADNCTASDSKMVTIYSTPLVFANATATNVCAGTSVTLTGSGTSVSYVWSGGVTDGAGFVPASTSPYIVTGTDANSCTNTSTIFITVNAFPGITTTLIGSVITANQNGAAYQWLDCSNGLSVIAGAINQSYTATANGNYAVVVTLNSCSDTSACVNINTTAMNEIGNTSQLVIYPNPNNGTFTMQSAVEGVYSIMNELGQTIRSVQLNMARSYLKIKYSFIELTIRSLEKGC